MLGRYVRSDIRTAKEIISCFSYIEKIFDGTSACFGDVKEYDTMLVRNWHFAN
jgi:hypothetical protein